MEPADVGRRRFRIAFVIILVVAVSALFLAVAWPFLKPLLLGALLAGLCHPLYRWITRLLRGRRSLGAIITLVILFIVVAGPLSAFLGVVVQQAVAVSNQAIPWVQQHFGPASTFNAHDWLVQTFPALADHVPSQEQLVGEKILEEIFYYLPLSDEDEALMLQRFSSITRATVKGTLVIGIIQGALAGFAFWVAGIDGAAFWGTIMAILSIVPGIGAALIWVPAVIYLMVTGELLAGLLLFAWCAAVVGTIDNILRPILVGKDAKMPDLLILVGTLGGLFLFGPIGFIVGPIVCGLFLTVWDIYGATFKDVLPPVKSLQSEIVNESDSET